ncbi:S-adenosyl-L-methionine-dependent methyltransferase [Suillus discolor]|uniref:S-adenosyl-L-methionine-dependent methyltransferase n=1 Tax=Suillus discolor TaxID=1912936 RepID=A0A9P7FH65_9AGAM|nr:S-adenosyl-L-methionine-dependent methyltransferase [Suillus discolor]KAG2116493.1 S-adenosyl-L-methionine-dependent methyltransferase [Suillus discolor]
MTTSVHPNALAGFATGTNEVYDRVRPLYPADCLSYVRSQVAKSTIPLKIVEIGAGTGIFTRALLAHSEWSPSIGTLRAIEPSGGMRDFWTKSVQDNRCTIVNGTFDDTGVEDGWADLIIIAQAFHWCLDYGKAFTEFARILNKGGAAVFVWYLADREAAGWVAQVQHCVEARGNGSPRFRLDVLRQGFSTPEYTSLFHPQEEKQWAHHGLATDQTVTDRALSWSYIAILPPDEKAEVAEGINDILERGDGKVWINKEQGTYQDPHTARAMISRKK